MNQRALTFVSVSAALLGLAVAAPAAAQTQCQPGDLFCAELQIGPGQGTIRIGPGTAQPAPPPQVVYVPPVRQRVVRQRREYPYSSLGINAWATGLWGEDLAMGGAGGAFRIRPMPHLAVDLGLGVYGGSDYNGLDRVELPVTADVLFFFNPENRFQFYAIVGAGVSFSHAEGVNRFTGSFDSRDYFHVGGAAGIGLEWRISRIFALSIDVRGFLRYRADDSEEPEFVEPADDGTWQSTDLSGGAATRLGMTFYFD
jgi:hypothetical protein